MQVSPSYFYAKAPVVTMNINTRWFTLYAKNGLAPKGGIQYQQGITQHVCQWITLLTSSCIHSLLVSSCFLLIQS